MIWGPTSLPKSTKLRMPVSESAAVRLQGISSRSRGKQPRPPTKAPKAYAKWERMWSRTDNQEVGLEAATLERVRNSSLVK